MSAIRPIFGLARGRIMHVSYHCDLTSSSAPVIPLGVMTDFRVGRVFGLGLRARTTLSPDELQLVGGLMRRDLERPFDMLRAEFDRVWNDTDRDAFLDLPEKHMGSLRFDLRQSYKPKLPRQLAVDDSSENEAVAQWAKDQMATNCRTSFWALLEEHWADKLGGAEEDIREKRAA